MIPSAHRSVSIGVLVATVGSTLLVAPPAPSVQSGVSAEQVELVRAEAPAASVYVHAPMASVYVRYVPPPPPPPPPPPLPAQAWTPPPGYATIPVPIYRQAMPLDCETAALRMGLATFGHYYSDSALFAYENPDLRSPVMGANHTVLQWGDPYTNFVGNVWGSDTTPTGYGIYYPVIVAIARSHGLPNAYGGEGFSPSTVYAALSAGHPVEVWVETFWARPRLGTWTAWDGRQVRYSLIEHAVTLSGISPWMVRVNDPLYGTQYWIGKGTFETVWADFNNMAVIF